MCNFVVHFKKEHICHGNKCIPKALCENCQQKLLVAKRNWQQQTKHDDIFCAQTNTKVSAASCSSSTNSRHQSMKINENCSTLEKEVKILLDMSKTQFTEWLLHKNLIRSDHTCDAHPNISMKLGMLS